MATAAIAAFGTLLKIGDGGGSESFTTIAEVVDLAGPNLTTKTLDATSHDSANATEEIIAGLKNAGQVTFSVNFIPAGATHSYSTGLIKDWYNRTKRNFQLIFPNVGATTWAFAAYVTGVSPKEPVQGKLIMDLTLSIAGAPTLA